MDGEVLHEWRRPYSSVWDRGRCGEAAAARLARLFPQGGGLSERRPARGLRGRRRHALRLWHGQAGPQLRGPVELSRPHPSRPRHRPRRPDLRADARVRGRAARGIRPARLAAARRFPRGALGGRLRAEQDLADPRRGEVGIPPSALWRRRLCARRSAAHQHGRRDHRGSRRELRLRRGRTGPAVVPRAGRDRRAGPRERAAAMGRARLLAGPARSRHPAERQHPAVRQLRLFREAGRPVPRRSSSTRRPWRSSGSMRAPPSGRSRA